MADGIGPERSEKPPGVLPEAAQPEKTYKTSDPRAHYVALDGLRGIAISLTVLNHTSFYWFYATQGHPLYVPLLGVDVGEFFQIGYLAVPFFYLLSGYLLTSTEEGRRRRGNYSVLNYAKRRALRIVPAYYLAIAEVVLWWPILLAPAGWSEADRPSLGTVALHLAFLQDFQPSYPRGLDGAWWSLTPEIVFYVALPLLVLKLRTFRQRAAILAVLLLASLAPRLLQSYGVFGFLSSPPDDAFGIARLYQFPTTLLYLFVVGMLLRMMVERRAKAGHEPGRWQPYVASAMSAVSAAALLAVACIGMASIHILHPIVDVITEGMVILVFASVLLGSPLLRPVLTFKPLVFIGEISYSMFLLHFTVILTMDRYLLDLRNTIGPWSLSQGELSAWAAFSVYLFSVLAAVVGVGYLGYRYVESPFLRRKPK